MLKNSQYDMELKQGFIEKLKSDRKQSTIKMFESLINKISNVEQMYGVSICQADTETRMAMISDCSTSNTVDNILLKSRIKQYLQYCHDQGATIFTQGEISTILIRESNIDWRYFSSWDEFENYLDLNLKPDELNSHDIIFRICFELIYLGVVPDDIYELKKKDFDYQESELRYNGTAISLPASVRERLRVVRDIEFYEFDRGDSVPIKVRVTQSDYLINDKSRNRMYLNMVYRLSQINKEYEIKHTSVYDIFLSGVMERAYCLPLESRISYICSETDRIKSKKGKSKNSIIEIFETWSNIKESRSC